MPNVPNPTAPRFVEDGLNYRRITCRGQDPSPVRKLGLWQPPKCRSGNTHCDFLRIKYWSCHMRSLSQQFPTKLNKHGPSKTSIIHLVVFYLSLETSIRNPGLTLVTAPREDWSRCSDRRSSRAAGRRTHQSWRPMECLPVARCVPGGMA